MNSLYKMALCLFVFNVFFFFTATADDSPYEDFDAGEILFPANEYPKHFFEHDVLNEAKKTSVFMINARQKDLDKNIAFFILLSLALFIAMIKNVSSRNYQNIWRSLKSVTISKQVFNDQKGSILFSHMLMNAIFYISFSLWVFYMYPILGITINKPSFTLFLIILGVIVLLFTLKTILIRFIAYLFPFGGSLRLFSFNCWQIYKATGILLIPFSLFIIFSTPTVSLISAYVSVFLILSVFLVRIFKGIIIGKKYFITEKKLFLLYICTLEIVPVILLIKILQNAQLI